MYSELQEHDKLGLRAFLHVALEAGYEVAIDDGNGEFSAPSTDFSWLLDNLGEMDVEEVKLHRGHLCDGWFMLVYGNGHGELIADYTANTPSQAIYDAWAAKVGAE